MSVEKETILFYGIPSYNVDTSKVPVDKYYDFIEELYINLDLLHEDSEVFYGLILIVLDDLTYSIKPVLEDEAYIQDDLLNVFKKYGVEITDNVTPQFYLAERYY